MIDKALLFKEIEEGEIVDSPCGGATYNGWTYTRKRKAYIKRAKELGTHTKEEWLTLCSWYSFRCCKCDGKVIGGVPTKDHVYPIKFGGNDSILNIQPLCRECNTSKGCGYEDYR